MSLSVNERAPDATELFNAKTAMGSAMIDTLVIHI